MNEPYTRITIEVYYPDKNDLHKTIVERNQWDCDITAMHEMWVQALAGIGFGGAEDFYNPNSE